MRVACLFAVVVAGSAGMSRGDEPEATLEVVSPRPHGIIATGINDRGDVIGFEWREEEKLPGVISQVPFYAKGEEMIDLPLLEGFTATFPNAVSDEGTVVGRVSRPIIPGVRQMLNQAFIWDAERGIRGLGVLEGDEGSFATGISHDGSRISGFSVGPNRVRACVWDREEDWTATAMPHEANLGSNVVAISDDGSKVSAVDGVLACLWTRGDDGEWTREIIAEPAQFIPRAVNDSSMVVGFRFDEDGHSRAMAWTRDGGMNQLGEPEGYTRSEASDVNNQGMVVGWIDGPMGSVVGPNPFVHENGVMRLITEGGPDFSTATAINNRGQVAGIFEDEEE